MASQSHFDITFKETASQGKLIGLIREQGFEDFCVGEWEQRAV